jgi:hypothetical protein
MLALSIERFAPRATSRAARAAAAVSDAEAIAALGKKETGASSFAAAAATPSPRLRDAAARRAPSRASEG